MIHNKWMFLIINWKPNICLELAVNGFKRAEATQGKFVTGLQPLDQEENICFGKNVAGTGTYFTQFYLASFVVFNQYLSPTLIRPIYLYYWTTGKYSLLIILIKH